MIRCRIICPMLFVRAREQVVYTVFQTCASDVLVILQEQLPESTSSLLLFRVIINIIS